MGIVLKPFFIGISAFWGGQTPVTSLTCAAFSDGQMQKSGLDVSVVVINRDYFTAENHNMNSFIQKPI